MPTDLQAKLDIASRCSFCDKPYKDVRKLIVGNRSSICDACVLLCYDVLQKAGILGESSVKSKGESAPGES